MAIYRKGQASMDAQGYITGYDTKWREQLTLIRPGATIVFLTQPLQLAVITEVINDTSIRAISTDGAIVPRSNYAILLHDSITVDGLAQDVAETLRYYQGKESEIAEAIEFFKTFNWKQFQDLAKQVEANAASASQSKDAAARSASDALNSKNAAKTSETNAKESENAANASKNAAKASETNAKASETAANSSKTAAANSASAALTSQNAAKTSETNAKNSENAANASKNAAKTSQDAALASQNAAKTSETNAKNSENAANTSKNAAKTSETNAKASENNALSSANKAKTEADRAEAAANSSDVSKKVPFAGVTLRSSGLKEMMQQLRDSVKGGFWRQDSDFTETLPSGAFAPYKYGAGVCGGAGDTFFAINVDFDSAKVKVFAGNNSAINGNQVKCKELATLSGGALPIDQGGTASKNAEEARNRLEVMHARANSLTTENLNSIKGTKKGFYFTSTSASCTPDRNYPVQEAGCLLVEQTAANSNDGCVQTYTTFNSYRVFKRMFNQSSGDTWTGWVEFYSANSTPSFKTQMSAGDGQKSVSVGVGSSDVFVRNSKANTYLQLRDDGKFFFNNAYVMYDGANKPGSDFTVTANNFVVKTGGNGLKIRGTTNDRSQALYLSAIQDNNTRLWYVGKSGNNSDLVINNDMLNSVILVSSNIELRTPGRNGGVFADGSALVVRRGNGREFKYENNQTAAKNGTILLWGNTSGRPSVVECKLSDGYLWYAQQNSDNSRVFNINGRAEATAFNQTSDRDLKDNIKKIENARSGLDKVGGYTYTLKEDGMPYAGVIAQEIMEVVPEAVSTSYKRIQDGVYGVNQDGSPLYLEERYYCVDYGAVTAYTLQVCKEQEEELRSLRSEVDELKALVAKLVGRK